MISSVMHFSEGVIPMMTLKIQCGRTLGNQGEKEARREEASFSSSLLAGAFFSMGIEA